MYLKLKIDVQQLILSGHQRRDPTTVHLSMTFIVQEHVYSLHVHSCAALHVHFLFTNLTSFHPRTARKEAEGKKVYPLLILLASIAILYIDM